MASLRNKKILIAPNTQYEFPIRGNTVKVVDSTCVVYFKTQDGQIDFYLEKGERASFENVNFLNLVIYHLETTDQKISISVGDGAEITSARVAGEVSVIDGSQKRVTQNKSFYAGLGALGVAGQYSHIQIFNPLGSTVNAYIDTIILDSNVDGAITLRQSTSEILELSTNGGNKNFSGGNTSQIKIKRENNAIVLGSQNITGMLLKASTPMSLSLKDVIRLSPGTGLIVVAQDVNTSIKASFQYYEETI